MLGSYKGSFKGPSKRFYRDFLGFRGLGVGAVISGVISPLLWIVSIVTLLISLLITTHEPPSVVRS